jgi:hypothetical protein
MNVITKTTDDLVRAVEERPSVIDLVEGSDGVYGRLAVPGPSRIERLIELEHDNTTNRWEAAQLYFEEAEGGATQAEIAGWVGKSKPHVHRMIRVWAEHGSKGEVERPDFQDAYRAAKEPKEPRVTRGNEGEPEVVEGEVVDDVVSIMGRFDPTGLSPDELRATRTSKGPAARRP